ncbi:hypothetical protein G7Y79_00070g096990 [Physcia stellaris]|nr:hypothetical protein G7Y79_00070g096990 [Physcia stellaris]
MSQAKRDRPFFRNSRIATFLYQAAAIIVAPANASPFTTSTQSSTSPITSSLPTATSSNSTPDRNGSFQVLADGTQDLAALVGIFATDSVERYAFNYSRGHLSSAVSMLSLLGLLGYVRALVKLAMGPEACENAGFDMKALRPMFGVSDTDRLPTSELYEMHYMERHTDGSEITWKRIRNTKHTKDSSALGRDLKLLDNKNRSESLYLYSYEIAHDGRMSEIKHFAYLRSETQHSYMVLNLRAISGYIRWGLRTTSLVAAPSAIAGYICQYIEVRRMSSRNAGIWLAAQGALAVIRLGIWVIDPAFDDHEFTEKVYDGSQLSELQLGLISNEVSKKEFRIPLWAAESLQATNFAFYQPFTMALSTYLGQNSGLDLMAKLQNATEYWDMPVKVFKSWVYTHSHPDLPLPMPKERLVDFRDYGARVIVDNDASYHVLPFQILKRAVLAKTYELKLFGNLKDEASTVFINWNFGPWRSRRDHDGTIKDGVRDSVIKTMDTMWKDLKYILKNRADIARRFLPDIFYYEEESSVQEPPETRAQTISNDSETPIIRRRRQSF